MTTSLTLLSRLTGFSDEDDPIRMRVAREKIFETLKKRKMFIMRVFIGYIIANVYTFLKRLKHAPNSHQVDINQAIHPP